MSLVQIDWNPDRRRLREFAVVWMAGFSLIAALVAWKLDCFAGSGRWTVPGVIGGAAAVVGLAGAAFPPLVRPLYVAWMGLALPMGLLTGNLMLGLAYFLVFTPVALVFRLIGRDALQRRFDPAAATYWESRPAAPPAERYFQQF